MHQNTLSGTTSIWQKINHCNPKLRNSWISVFIAMALFGLKICEPSFNKCLNSPQTHSIAQCIARPACIYLIQCICNWKIEHSSRALFHLYNKPISKSTKEFFPVAGLFQNIHVFFVIRAKTATDKGCASYGLVSLIEMIFFKLFVAELLSILGAYN